MLTATQSRLIVDARGEFCPMPIIKLSQAIALITVGETLQLLSTDPATQHDIRAWARRTNHELLDSRAESGEFQIVVRRTH